MAGIYFVQGKLGSGKGLVSVGKIQEYLLRGCVVATNMDIYLHNIVPKDNKTAKLIRLPDCPTVEDLEALGEANPTYDDKKNGLLCLDEGLIWFDAQGWNEPWRKAFRSHLVQLRKDGWDLIFQVQDIDCIDGVARKTICEHVVRCMRLDRIPIPIVGFFLKIFSGTLRLPKVHLGRVFYGTSHNSPKVDTWEYHGTSLYNCYDTKQKFDTESKMDTLCFLPPYVTHFKSMSPKNWSFYMRMTKIYFKRFRVSTVFVFGFIVCFFLLAFLQKDSDLATASIPSEKIDIIEIPDQPAQLEREIVFPVVDSVKPDMSFYTRLNYYVISQDGVDLLRIVYLGFTYSYDDFPYPVLIKNNSVFGLLPVSDNNTS